MHNLGMSPGSLPLVGRSIEQRTLRDGLAAACEGRGSLIVIGGEAGIGKTSLVRDLASEAADQSFGVLTGHCYDLSVTPPYGPWLELATAYRAEDSAASLPAPLATGRIEEIESQASFFAEVRQCLAEMASTRTVLLVLEDLHWADSASLELLRYVGAGIASHPVLILVTYRRDELTRSHAFYQHFPALIRETNGRRLDLHPLDVEDLRSLVGARHPMCEADADRLVTYLERHAEGNPFFVLELLRALIENDFLRESEGQWELDELDRIVMPSLVRQVIDGRVSRLGEQTRETLAVAAVIGQDVPLDLWARVLDLDENDLMPIVETAIGAHLMDAARDGTRARFVHALTRETLYESIFPPRRRRWHQLVGDALAKGIAVNPDAVAFHYQEASDARAWEWFVQAGDRAQRAYSWLMAKERFEAAASLLKDIPGMEARRSRLLYRCGRLQRYSDTAAGIANLTAAERVANLAGNRVLAADARYSRGLLHLFADEFGLGLEEMESGILELEGLRADDARESWDRATWMADALPPRELANTPEADPATQVLIDVGFHHRRGGLPWFLAAAGYLERAQIMAEQFTSLVDGVATGELVISAAGHSHFGLGLAHAARGRPVEARQSFARARERYDQLEHHAVIGFTHLCELRDVVLPYYATQVAERRRLAYASEAALDQAAGAFPSDRSSRRARLGLLYLEGKWDEAAAIASEVEVHGNYVLRREFTNAMAPLWYQQGRSDLVRDVVLQLLPQGAAAEPGTVVLLDGLLLQRIAADLALDRGDASAALAWLEANDRWLAWSGAVLGRSENRTSWARYCRHAGGLGHALAHADAAVDLASEPEQPLALLAAHRLRAELRIESNSLDGAEQDIKNALKLADACAAPFERALTLIARSELRLAQQRRDEARSDLAEAREILTPLHAQLALARVDDLAARFITADAIAPAGLTPRELEVLRLVALGMTDAGVGDRLYISPRTVSQHLRSVYGKIGVSSRAAATRFAVEHGLT